MTLSRLRWLILGLLFLSTVISYLDRQALSVLVPILRRDLGFSGADYGAIATVFLLAYTMAQIPVGMWIDRVGARVGLAVAVVVWSVASILHAVARGPISFGILRGILGMGEAGNTPAGSKAIASWFPQKRCAFAMALFDCGGAIGAVIAPPIVAVLAMHCGWQMAFTVTGGCSLLWVAGWLWVYHAPGEHPWLAEEAREQLKREVGVVAPKSRAFGSAMRRILGMRQLWGLMMTRLLAAPVWWFYVFWLPDYLSLGRGLSLKAIGFYAWIPYLTVDLGKIVGGLVSDALVSRGCSAAFARKSVMLLGALGMLSGLQVVNAPSAAMALGWVCVATFGFGAWSATMLALHADIFPPEAMASAMGATLMASGISGAAFTYAIGKVVDHLGYAPAFGMVGILPIAACVPLLLWVGKVERIREPEPDLS